MKLHLAACLFVALLISCTTPSDHHPDLSVIRTDAGYVRGALNGDSTIHIFKGVPFAAPPVGELRWKAPQPHAPWNDTLTCMSFGPSPIQNNPVPFAMWTQEFISPAKPLSEDCLYLNVWTPAKKAGEKLPVLVWIYGGGFGSGSAACPVYDGEAVAREGIIFVSMNYRVGVFGFMAHPQLTAESPHHASGNYGLLDQHAALEWVKENIAAFGGDPAQVTIDGQSAGSMSVQAQAASPLNKGLLSGAIAESGGMGWRTMKTLAEAEQSGTQMGKDIEALRQLSADSVWSMAHKIPFGGFSPIVDGYFLPEQPSEIFRNKKQNDVAVMAGWVTGDAGLFMEHPRTPKEFRQHLKENFKDPDALIKVFPVTSDSLSRKSQATLGILEFAGFPYRIWATSDTSRFYMYEDRFIPTDKPGFPNYGAFHTSDVPFALHTLDKWDRPWTEGDREMERVMSAYWANFIKTGDPNGSGLPQWEPYDRSTGAIMILSETPGTKTGYLNAQLSALDQ